MESTKKTIYFESLYFLPPSKLRNLFLKKLEAGIQFRVLTNSSDSIDFGSGEILALSVKYFLLFKLKGLKLFGLKGRSWKSDKKSSLSIHSKTYVFDESVFIGSFNLDPRSFSVNLESSVIIENHAKLAIHVQNSIKKRIRLQALPMNQWGQLMHKNKLIGTWSAMKTLKYYWTIMLRRFTENYYWEKSFCCQRCNPWSLHVHSLSWKASKEIK